MGDNKGGGMGEKKRGLEKKGRGMCQKGGGERGKKEREKGKKGRRERKKRGGRRKMRDFTLPWGLLVGLVQCMWTELPTASGPKSARVYFGYRPVPTRCGPPPRQYGGGIRAPVLACVECVCVEVVAVHVCSGGRFVVQHCVSFPQERRKKEEGWEKRGGGKK